MYDMTDVAPRCGRIAFSVKMDGPDTLYAGHSGYAKNRAESDMKCGKSNGMLLWLCSAIRLPPYFLM